MLDTQWYYTVVLSRQYTDFSHYQMACPSRRRTGLVSRIPSDVGNNAGEGFNCFPEPVSLISGEMGVPLSFESIPGLAVPTIVVRHQSYICFYK